jgi:hypothetical protein
VPSTAFTRFTNAPATGDALIDLLDVTHDDLTGIGYIACNTEDVIHAGKRYVGTAFGVQPNERGSFEISLDIVNPEIRREVHRATAPLRATYLCVFAHNPDEIEYGPFTDLILRDVSWTDLTLTGTLELDSVEAQIVPGDYYSPQNTPGIY